MWGWGGGNTKTGVLTEDTMVLHKSGNVSLYMSYITSYRQIHHLISVMIYDIPCIISHYKVSRRNGVDFISRERLYSTRGNIGIPDACVSCLFCCCMIRIPEMRSDDAYLIAS